MSTETNFLKLTRKNFEEMKSQAEKAMDQLSVEELHFAPNEESNSIAIIVKHMSGNLRSRFSSFLTTDGEKPDRNRDGEFIGEYESRNALLEDWESGWNVLFGTLGDLTDSDLDRTVFIRQEPYSVMSAIQRSVVHSMGHVGQIIYIAKMIKNDSWKTLSIPRAK
ncbi:DUF1572 family protein [Bacillus sp. B-jedd]|uniref:DUF1572 family protein n=1 Tax=Bacillus sp. B-jedd TaxID=1476857 RepID=UPI0005155A55|nr:DUF1572 family protein [Bacillus sp. B-jedd]CEG28908.1 Hypothetical protein BN1002_03833 [Bacillus sp. B-jedd]